MILIDVNLLVYASDDASPDHARAKRWLDGRLNESPRVGLPWESITGFVRVSSNARFVHNCMTAAAAWKVAQTWLDLPNVFIPQPALDHRAVLNRLIAAVPMTHKLVADAHLAAIAISHRLTLCSADTDFAKFPGLSFINPLA
jgi:toxin-antitoxin system PIN domain toxin